jgi:hypothetical protein
MSAATFTADELELVLGVLQRASQSFSEGDLEWLGDLLERVRGGQPGHVIAADMMRAASVIHKIATMYQRVQARRAMRKAARDAPAALQLEAPP